MKEKNVKLIIFGIIFCFFSFAWIMLWAFFLLIFHSPAGELFRSIITTPFCEDHFPLCDPEWILAYFSPMLLVIFLSYNGSWKSARPYIVTATILLSIWFFWLTFGG